MKTPQLLPYPVRTLLHIETRTPPPDESPSPGGEGRGEGELSTPPAVLDFTSSTAAVDRYHEIIDPAGWHLDAYRRNPVFQNAHQYGDILFTLGKALITEVRTSPPPADPLPSEGRGIKGEGLAGHPLPSDGRGAGGEGRPVLFQRIQFATDINPMARIAYGLYRGKFLNAVSVGFVPLRWENGPEGSSYKRKYVEQELLEVSAVAIPANPNALALAVKSGAVTKSDLADTLDLLRRLTVDYGPWRPSSVPPRTQLSTLNPQLLLNLARELRRILRRA